MGTSHPAVACVPCHPQTTVGPAGETVAHLEDGVTQADSLPGGVRPELVSWKLDVKWGFQSDSGVLTGLGGAVRIGRNSGL